ncbi:MAG: hypothetical protein ACRDE8_00055, partial [Ginsengibacter sp.]
MIKEQIAEFLLCLSLRLMQLFDKSSHIIITCNKRLAPYLQKEVEELGFTIFLTFSTGVQLTGTLNDCINLNLNLRCASQVLYSLKSFACESPAQLYDSVSK